MNKYLEKLAEDNDGGHGRALVRGARAWGRGTLESIGGGLLGTVAGGALGAGLGHVAGNRGIGVLTGGSLGGLSGALGGGLHGLGRSTQNQGNLEEGHGKAVARGARVWGRGLVEGVGGGVVGGLTGGVIGRPVLGSLIGSTVGALHGYGRSVQNQGKLHEKTAALVKVAANRLGQHLMRKGYKLGDATNASINLAYGGGLAPSGVMRAGGNGSFRPGGFYEPLKVSGDVLAEGPSLASRLKKYKASKPAAPSAAAAPATPTTMLGKAKGLAGKAMSLAKAHPYRAAGLAGLGLGAAYGANRMMSNDNSTPQGYYQ